MVKKKVKDIYRQFKEKGMQIANNHEKVSHTISLKTQEYTNQNS